MHARKRALANTHPRAPTRTQTDRQTHTHTHTHACTHTRHAPRSAEERPNRIAANRAAATKVADAQSKWIYLGYGAALGGLLNMCAWLLWSYMSR